MKKRFEVQFRIHSRDDMILLGQTVGNLVKGSLEAKPQALVTMWVTANSGKSLLALAADQAFRPQIYEKGIDKDHCANYLDKQGLPVVFDNFAMLAAYTQADVDRHLNAFLSKYPDASLYFAANLTRGKISKMADLDICVKTLKGLKRQIRCTTDNSRTAEKLASLPFHFIKHLG